MSRVYLPGSEIEIVNDIECGHIRHALFDFDGTISLLREGWEGVMHPICVRMICGSTPPTPEIESAVARMIDETTGIQTIFQMERLIEMIREHALVPESEIKTPLFYKQAYLDGLMERVRLRHAEIQERTKHPHDYSVRGAHDFLSKLAAKGAAMYVFSGTDRDDVRREAALLEVAPHFQEIWGALDNVEEYSKEKVLRDIIAQHKLHGREVVAVGDGPVEIRNVKDCGGIAIGVASDEIKGYGLNEKKRERLIRAGADIIIGDFSEGDLLLAYLYGN